MSQPQSEAARVVGRRISEHRRAARISQMELGELAGVHFTSLGRIERGLANPTLTTLVKIAVALDIDPAELVTGLGADDLPETEPPFRVSDFVRMREHAQRSD
jgi:transcriptional regulator with XRE-family HTH domain